MLAQAKKRVSHKRTKAESLDLAMAIIAALSVSFFISPAALLSSLRIFIGT